MNNVHHLVQSFVKTRNLAKPEESIVYLFALHMETGKSPDALLRKFIAELLMNETIDPGMVPSTISLCEDFLAHVQSLSEKQSSNKRADGLRAEDLPAAMDIMIHEFLESKNRKSVDHYRERLTRFGLYLVQHHGLRDFRAAKPQHLVSYQKWQEAIGNRPATIHHDYRHIRAFFNFLIETYPEETGLRHADLRKVEPNRPKTAPKYLDDVAVNHLVRYVRSLPMNKFWSFRDRMIATLLLETGARSEEVCKLTTRHVLDTGRTTLTLLLDGKGAKERYVTLGAKVSTELKLYLKMREEYLGAAGGHGPLFFSRRATPEGQHRALTPNTLYQLMNRLRQRAGIQQPVGVHRLRHTAARGRLDRGMPLTALQDSLGHEEAATTYLYSRFRDRDLRDYELKTSFFDNLSAVG